MAKFDINIFTDRLIELFINSPIFPVFDINKWNNRQGDRNKHPFRNPLTLKESVDNSIKGSRLAEQDMITFDIGNEQMEETHPYYHILEDAPYIRKAGKGTAKTKGSQAKVENIGKRDYGIVNWNGKTFSKEYSRNTRGSRNRLDKVTHYITDNKGDIKLINREANSYLNEHYKYIERILDSGILNTLAAEQGLKLSKRKIDTGLAEEYFSQFDETPLNILDILGSHA